MVMGYGPTPYLGFPLYHNSDPGNGIEIQHTIYTEDDMESILYYISSVFTLNDKGDDFI